MNDSYIGPVRPIFNLEEKPPENKKCERLIVGTSDSGMMIDVTKKGLELNAYYLGFYKEDGRYAVLHKPVIIPWAELDKIKERIHKLKKKGKAELDRIEEELDLEYLETLPIVTISGRRHYIDPTKRERRSVDKPHQVWRF